MPNDFEARSLWSRPLSRRSVIRGAGAVLGATFAGAALAGCGGSTPQSATATPGSWGMLSAAATGTPAPRRGGTLTHPVAAQMTTLNPHTGSTWADRYVHDHLFNYDHKNGRYDLCLAQSLENPDPLTVLYKIKPNAKHQNLPPVNGRTVEAQDVIASWNAFVANPRTSNKSVFTDYLDHYETPDAKTLIMKLKQANAWLIGPHGLGAPYTTIIVPKELFEGDTADRVAVGCGPYVLDQFDPASIISFKRRPDGWHVADRPYIDNVVCRVITDPAARAAALKAKQIDYLVARDKMEADEFKSYGPDMQIFRELSYPPVVWLRAETGGLFADVRVREAVYNALDIKELIDKVELGEGEYSGPVPPYLAAWSLPKEELQKQFPHDIQKAKQLLTAAGFDTSKEIEFKYPSDQKTALLVEILQKQLASVGIKTKLVPQDPNTVWVPNTLTPKNFEITATIARQTSQDPDAWLRTQTTQGYGGGNATRWTVPEYDAIVAKQQAEFDPQKQKQIILDAQRWLFKNFTGYILLYAPYSFTCGWGYYHADRDHGYAGIFGHYDWTEKA